MDELFTFHEGGPTVEFFDAVGPLVLGRVTGRAIVPATGERIDFLVTERFTVRASPGRWPA